MNRLLCIQEGASNDPTVPDQYLVKVGSQYTISGTKTIFPWGLWYTLWEMPTHIRYHESLFATLSDDFETEHRKHSRVDRVPYEVGTGLTRGRLFDEQGYED